MTSTPTGARHSYDQHAHDQHAYDSSTTTRLRIPRQHPKHPTGRDPRRRRPLPKYDYEHYSRLAGPLTQPDPAHPYRVRYRSLLADEPHRIRAALLLGAAPLVSLGLLVWLIQPAHWTDRTGVSPTMAVLDTVMLVSIGLIELFRTMNVASNAHATLVARDPVPVVPETGTKVAFITTFVQNVVPAAADF